MLKMRRNSKRKEKDTKYFGKYAMVCAKLKIYTVMFVLYLILSFCEYAKALKLNKKKYHWEMGICTF